MIEMLATSTDPRDNEQKIRALHEATWSPTPDHADLYRAAAGPDGVVTPVWVGRIRYHNLGHTFVIIGADGRSVVGYADHIYSDCWRIEDYAGVVLGFSSTLAIGCDVLIHGRQIALGRHDARRTDLGWFRAESS